MKIEKIDKDITMIRLGGLNSNIYLIKGKVLIDSGLSSEGLLRKALSDIGIMPKDIERIIFTHGHYDHTGGSKLFKNARLCIHKDDASILEEGDSRKSCAFAFGKEQHKMSIDLVLHDNDIIRIDDLRFDILHTPGHTGGSICLYEPERKLLISGDTLLMDTTGRTDLPGSSEKKMSCSLERLKTLDVDLILPGHGKVMKDGNNMIERISRDLGY